MAFKERKNKKKGEQLTIFHILKGQKEIIDRLDRIEEYNAYLIDKKYNDERHI